MAIKKIPVHKLRIGMFIEDLDRPWLDSPFFFHRKKVKDQKLIAKFISHGIQHVMINTDKGIDCEEQSVLDQHEKSHLIDIPEKPATLPSQPQDDEPVKLNEELPRAKEIKTNVSRVVKNVFNDVRMGKAIELNEVREQVNSIVDSVFRNRDALLCLANLKDYDNYTFMHSVNVCILAVSFARHLGMTKGHLENIGVGAILHDIGKTRIPESILNKPGRYTEEEYSIMRRHVMLGVDILHKYENIPDDAMSVTMQHHERYDGSGYPQRLHGEKIALSGQIAGIADVYDALTYDRVYHKASSCHSTVKKLYEWGDTLFDKTLIERLILCIGIYPFGSFVELNTGQCGVVVSVNHQMLICPKVLILLNKDKERQNPLLVDLAREKDENGDYKYSIKRELDPTPWGVDVNQYITPLSL